MKRFFACLLIISILAVPVSAATIRWVDFGVPYESLKYALDQDIATFEQEMYLQGGDYLLSISCTGYDSTGEFQVYHRLYDALNMTVISDKDTVGFYDMNSKTSIEKVEG